MALRVPALVARLPPNGVVGGLTPNAPLIDEADSDDALPSSTANPCANSVRKSIGPAGVDTTVGTGAAVDETPAAAAAAPLTALGEDT
jgi:hypothetical protein